MLFLSIQFANAQNEEPVGNSGNDPDIPNIPIDGGLSFLLVAGAAYGGKRVHEYRKRKSNPSNHENP